MRTRSRGFTLLAGLAIVLSACSNTGSTGSAAASVAPDPCAGAAANASHTAPTDWSKAKIGVATDIGTLDDKNYNEYTFKGAATGATDLKAAAPKSVVPKDASEYIKNIQAFVDQGFDIIVTAGFNNAAATTCEAHLNPSVWFIGVDQSPICIDATGKLDPTFGCKGDAKTLAKNYISLEYQEDQPGYLAGMVAASVSKTGIVGAIGGTSLCGPCIRYIQGFELGAKSINPAIKVFSAYVTNDFSNKAFNDPVTGTSFAQQFISQNHPDVLFQVAGKTGNGIIDAACSANLYAIGVDVDQFLSYPNGDKCIVTSAEKKLTLTVEASIKAIGAGTAAGGDSLWNAKNDGIGISDFHDKKSLISADLQSKLDAAMAAMKAGSLKTCPDKCGVLAAPASSPAPSAS
ncbi:MAG: basic rane protein [Chloroflexota bacterium]|jgi:basic membrane protein A|nr:basic rane protein [Chloroflexota bacterium]